MVAGLHNVSVTIGIAHGAKRLQFKTSSDFHPYRKPKRRGLIITADNISVLKFLARGKPYQPAKPEVPAL